MLSKMEPKVFSSRLVFDRGGLRFKANVIYTLNLPFSGVLLYLGFSLTEWEKDAF